MSTSIADQLRPGFTRTLGLMEIITNGIAPERFARCPEDHADMNHPAFILGHLSIYPDMLLEMFGASDQAAPRDGYQDLFSPAARCQDDPDGSIYPAMADLIAYNAQRHETLRAVLETVTDEQMTAEMPVERMRTLFPTVGAGCAFLTGAHLMFHLGQLSAWRRVEGLGPAMPHVGD